MLGDGAGLHRGVIGLAGPAEDQRVGGVDNLRRAVGAEGDLLVLQVGSGLLPGHLGRDVRRGVGDLAHRVRHQIGILLDIAAGDRRLRSGRGNDSFADCGEGYHQSSNGAAAAATPATALTLPANSALLAADL